MADATFRDRLASLKKGTEEEDMRVNVNGKIAALTSGGRRKVEARAAESIGEELTLRELRLARKLTQVRVAKALGITQDSVSRLENRSDLLLSTLRKAVAAMGGSLSLVAEFPDRGPVVLAGVSGADSEAGAPTGGGAFSRTGSAGGFGEGEAHIEEGG